MAQATAGLTAGTFDAAGGTADTIYILYDDGTDSYLGLLVSNGGNNAFTGDTLTILATFQGVADATTFTAANFADFI